MKKSLSAILALGLCAGLSGCSTLRNKDVEAVAPVVEQVKPEYIDVVTSTGDIFTYELAGGESMLNNLKLLDYQVGIERGIVKENSIKVHGVSTPNFVANYLSLMDKNRNMIVTWDEFYAGRDEIYSKLDEKRANLSERVEGDLIWGRSDEGSVSNKLAVPTRITPNMIK